MTRRWRLAGILRGKNVNEGVRKQRPRQTELKVRTETSRQTPGLLNRMRNWIICPSQACRQSRFTPFHKLMGFPASEGRIGGVFFQMSALQSPQIFTHDNVKPSGRRSHLGLIMSPQNYQSRDEAEGRKKGMSGRRRGGRMKGEEKDEREGGEGSAEAAGLEEKGKHQQDKL